jgi:hypothetical protein
MREKRTTRNQGNRKNNTPYPLRSRNGEGASPSYFTPEEGEWDSRKRPAFTEATVLLVLARTPQQLGAYGLTYQCSGCGEFFHRKKDLTHGDAKRLGFITLDHQKPWQIYVSENAEPNEEGVITQEAAKDAYNNPANLTPLCNGCNSSKNGWGF